MRKYNFIYKKLVPSDNDFIGIVAYAIYKKEKIEFIENFKIKNSRDPTDLELESFHNFTTSDAQIRHYRNAAENDLEAFLDIVLSTKTEEIEGFYRDAFRQVAKESGHGFWYGIWQGLISSILYTILIGVIVIFTWSMQQGPKQVIERIFDIKITQQDSTANKRE